jgi:hypothetical protein
MLDRHKRSKPWTDDYRRVWLLWDDVSSECSRNKRPPPNGAHVASTSTNWFWWHQKCPSFSFLVIIGPSGLSLYLRRLFDDPEVYKTRYFRISSRWYNGFDCQPRLRCSAAVKSLIQWAIPLQDLAFRWADHSSKGTHRCKI